MPNITGNKKWKEVYESLAAEICNGGYKPGDRFHTISEISERFRVSRATTRKALSVLAEEKAIILKPRIGTVIRNGGKKRARILFCLPDGDKIPDIQNLPLIYFEILKGVFHGASSEGLEVEFLSRKEILAGGMKKPVLVFYGSEKSFSKLNPSNKEPKNLVVLHSPRPLKNFHTVRHDLTRAAYLATIHLIEKGHVKIGMITGNLQRESALPRFEGYISALKEKGIRLDLKLIRENIGSTQENHASAESLLAEPDPPTAILAGNDRRALDILEYCSARGIRVPEDLAVCGIDNVRESRVSSPALTTVDTGWMKIGMEAVNFILELYEKAGDGEIRDIVVEPCLVIRDST